MYFMEEKSQSGGLIWQGKKEYAIPQKILFDIQKLDFIKSLIVFINQVSKSLYKSILLVWEKDLSKFKKKEDEKKFSIANSAKKAFLMNSMAFIDMVMKKAETYPNQELEDIFISYADKMIDFAFHLFQSTAFPSSSLFLQVEKGEELMAVSKSQKNNILKTYYRNGKEVEE